MTEAQKRFVELERKKEEVKKFYEEFKAATEALVKESGLNSYFMDDQGIVYKIVEADGKWVPFDKFSYVRTKRPGEQRGSLSVKEAKERGFNVE